MNPDFLCLQEVKLNPTAIPEEDFGFSFTKYHLAEKNGYSGTAIYSKQDPLNVSLDFPAGSYAGEGRMITCEYDGFYLVNVYVPNSKGDLSRLPYRYDSWDPDLKDYLIELRAKSQWYYVVILMLHTAKSIWQIQRAIEKMPGSPMRKGRNLQPLGRRIS